MGRESPKSLSLGRIGPGGQIIIHVQKNVEIVDIFLESFTFLKKAIYGHDVTFNYFISGWMKACAIWWGFRVHSLYI